MKLIQWSYMNLVLIMIRLESGKLFCTSSMLCKALGITEGALRLIYKRNKVRLEPNCVSFGNANAKEFLQEHREELELNYIRGNMMLWNEAAMIMVAMASTSEGAYEFQDGVIELIKAQARQDMVPAAEHERVLEALGVSREEYAIIHEENAVIQRRLDAMEETLHKAYPALMTSASAAGYALSAHKNLKDLRKPN